MINNSKRGKRLFVFLISLLLIINQSGYLSLVTAYGATDKGTGESAAAETVYMLTDRLEAGKDYVVANGESGTVKILERDGDGVTSANAEVVSDANGTYIKDAGEAAAWTAKSGDGGAFTLENSGHAISVQDGVLAASHDGGDSWSYDDGTGQLSTAGSDDAPASVTYDDGFTVSDDGSGIKLFVETEIATGEDTDAVTERGPPAEEETATEAKGEEKAEKADKSAAVKGAGSGGTQYLGFTSDVHNSSNNASAERLADWINAIKGMYGDIDYMGFCGDMGDAGASESSFWTYAGKVISVVSKAGIPACYTTGNHEYSPGNFNSTSSSVKDNYTLNAAATNLPEGANYHIYALGAASSSQSYSTEQKNALSAYLASVTDGKPIIILTHFPLHRYSSGWQNRTTGNADQIIGVLNDAAAEGKTIVFLWGHNHTLSDSYYDKIYTPGEKIEYASGSEATIQFYYGAAGCMSDSDYGSGSGSVGGKGLVIQINPDLSLGFGYYDQNGNDKTKGGSTIYVEPVPVTGLSIEGAAEGKTVEMGRSIRLTAVIEPSDATTKTVSWSSSNETVAKVDSNGKVTGKSVGTATITATVNDTTRRDVFTADIEVEVTERTSAEQYFVIMIDDYALSNNISTQSLSNSSGYVYYGLDTVTYNVNDPAPYNILWTLEEADGEENGYYIKSYSGDYLSATYVSNGRGYTGTLTVGETKDVWYPTSGDGLTTWQGDGSYLKSKTASDNPRPADIYLTYRASDNSVDFFTVGSSSNYKISKLIEPTEILEPVAVTGIELDPTTLEIQVGKSAPITANVLPADAADKTVEWTSSDESIATVSNTGRVKGIGTGTATITATTNDGGHTATCQVTVTPSAAPGIGYVITIGGYAMSCEPSSDQLVNAGSGTQQYRYTGLTGVPYDGSSTPTEDLLWLIEPTTGGYHIMTQDGQYLRATYETNETGGSTGTLTVGDTPDVWTFEGSLEDWVLNGSTLTSSNSGKSLTHEEGSTSTPLNLFTVRSTGESSTMIDPDNPAEVRFIETDSFRSGSDYIIAASKDGASVYALANVTGTSSGNTGSVTLGANEYFAASGDEAAYIKTSDTTVVWNRTSNNYLSNNGRYLSRSTSGTIVPRTSGTGRAVTYDATNKRLSISYSGTYYLTNSSGTFGYTQTANNATQIRLFEKSTVFNFKYVVQFVSNGVNYQSGKYATGEVPVYSGETPTREETAQYTYTFSGWSADGGTTLYGPDEDLPAVDGPVTYVAQFTAVPKPTEATVTFVSNGGSTVEPQTINVGEAATEPEAPVKEGCYTFDTWCSDEGLETPYVFSTPVEGDITLYARWTDDHSLTKTEAVEATCTTAGNSAYWTCSKCGKFFSDAEGTTEINEDDWVIPMTGHHMTKTDAVEATCLEAGNSAYWYCDKCEKYFGDEEGTTEINENDWVIAALGHNWSEWNVTTQPTCTVAGEKTRTCSRCDAVETEAIAATGHHMTKTDAVEATCLEAGNSAYWYCDNCEKYFSDAEGSTEINENDWVIAALGHDWSEWQVTTQPTCTVAGEKTRTCSRCDAVETEAVEATGHTPETIPAVEPTCTEPGSTEGVKCSVCDEVLTAPTEVAALGHNYQEVPDSAVAPTCTIAGKAADKKCSRCGDEITGAEIEATGHTEETIPAVEPTCTEPGSTEGVKCSVCNEILTAPTEVAALGHDYQEVPDSAVAPTCTEAGKAADKKCSRCGDVVQGAEIPAIGHTPEVIPAVAATCTTAGSTEGWKCSVCGEILTAPEEVAALGHDWGEWEVTTQPTCTEAGEKIHNCSRCDATETETIEATGHTAEVIPAVEPTCTEPGSTEGSKCSVCGEVLTAPTEVEALGHDYQEVPDSAVEPTCTTAGKEADKKCSRCGDEIPGAEIAKLDHTPEVIPAVAATCTEPGSTEGVKCSVCGEVLTAPTEIEALGHDYEEVEGTAVGPTCTAAGKEADKKCSRCGDEIPGAEIAKLDHTPEVIPAVAATCTEPGSTEGSKCSVCGEILVAPTEIEALGHDYEEVEGTAVEPTCTAAGKEADKKCSRCGDEITGAEIAKIDHTPEVIPAVAATCTEPGSTEGSKCSVCGEILVAPEEVEALGHDWSEWEVTTQPTCTVAGEKTRTCSRCDATETEAVEATGHTAEVIPAVEPTCTEPGSTEGSKCSVCGEVLTAPTEVEALGHDYVEVPDSAVEPTCTAAGKEADKKCSRCGDEITGAEIAKIDHTPEVIPAVAATCTEPGSTEGSKCSVCGEVLVAPTEVEALGHDYVEVPDSAVAPTCTAAGKEADKKCSRCGDEIPGAEIAKLDHTPEVIPAVAATCTEPGSTEGSKCSVCGETLVAPEEVEALGHNYEEVPDSAVEPTCTAAGKAADKKCSRCGDEIPGAEIAATGHTEETIPAVAATCTEPGSTEGVKCSVCGEVLTAPTEIEALGHDYVEVPDSAVEPTCTAAGKEADKKCSRCGDEITGAEIAKIDHTPEVIPAVAATCTEPGSTEGSKCSVCGEVLTEPEVIEALGHDYQDVEGTAIEATCTEGGRTADRKCSRCGDVIEGTETEALGHDWDNGKVTKKATASAPGVRTYTCKRCGETRTEVIPMLKLGQTTNKGTVVDASKKTIQIKYTAVDGATDYEVSYRVAGASKWTTKRAGNKTEYTITGLTSKKMYDVRVRAYRESDKSYGAYSTVSHRYISALVSRKVTAPAAGQIKVSWKKDTSASGYIIMYSTKRNMSGATKVTVAGGSKTSKVIKGLKKGKTYYVKVRPYKTKSGTKYSGAIKFTTPQSIKIK